MRALLSVTDKTNIEWVAQELEKMGVEIVSTGGTLTVLRDYGIKAIDIEKVTDFPEILNGRVKTLSPMIHGGILYRRDIKDDVETVEKYNINGIDIVIVNLYDFENALKTNNEKNIIENIDIGGPTLIRAAAKNFKDVLVVTEPGDYEILIENLKNKNCDYEFRKYLAAKAFSRTAYYDSIISRYFQDQFEEENFKTKTIGLKKISNLRYGENPSQRAFLYRDEYVNSLLSDIELLHGKEMSFNNYNDLNAAIELAEELGENSAVALKHSTPCGAGIGENVYDAFFKAYDSDKVSIFGGIVAINGIVDKDTAVLMSEIFLEIIAASDFTEEALEILERKKNVRIIKVDYSKEKSQKDIKYLNGVVLIQERDTAEGLYNVVTEKKPTEKELSDMKFAMSVCKYTKSNAIVVAKNGKTLGIGGGQTSRIWALQNIKNNYTDVDFNNAVLASDAFFPFDDCVTLADEMGISAIIQPGGSKRDKDSIDKCNEKDIAMVFTGQRHFRH